MDQGVGEVSAVATSHSGCGYRSEQRGSGFESATCGTGIDAGRGSTGSFSHLARRRSRRRASRTPSERRLDGGGKSGGGTGAAATARTVDAGHAHPCAYVLGQGQQSHGRLASTRPGLAKGQASGATGHSGRGVKYAGTGGGSIGCGLAAVTGRGVRQGQTPIATAADLDLFGRSASKTTSLARSGRDTCCGHPAGGAPSP